MDKKIPSLSIWLFFGGVLFMFFHYGLGLAYLVYSFGYYIYHGLGKKNVPRSLESINEGYGQFLQIGLAILFFGGLLALLITMLTGGLFTFAILGVLTPIAWLLYLLYLPLVFSIILTAWNISVFRKKKN